MKVCLRKINLAEETRVPTGKIRPGAMVLLAHGAVLEAETRGASVNGAFNDVRHRAVRAALDGLTSKELRWLADSIGRAARIRQSSEIHESVAFDVWLNEDRHRQGRHTEPQPPDGGWEPECPLCNPTGWRKYVWGI